MATRKKPLLDTTSPEGKRVQKRLEKELIIWLATCGRDGRPRAVPVWFLWDGKSFLIYSVPGQKVNDIEANPKVQLHFNTTPDGDGVVRIDGEATRLKRHPLAHKVPSYIRKYARLIKGYDWTPESFARQYNIALRVQPTRLRT
jgi:PPOX class probable F420-dependent enzyme